VLTTQDEPIIPQRGPKNIKGGDKLRYVASGPAPYDTNSAVSPCGGNATSTSTSVCSLSVAP